VARAMMEGLNPTFSAGKPHLHISQNATRPRRCGWNKSTRVNAYLFDSELLFVFTTQIFAPSNATPCGNRPTGKVPITVPSSTRSLVTVSAPLLATHMLVPSKARFIGV